MIVAINGGSHANPCFAGDTVRAWSEVLDKARPPASRRGRAAAAAGDAGEGAQLLRGRAESSVERLNGARYPDGHPRPETHIMSTSLPIPRAARCPCPTSARPLLLRLSVAGTFIYHDQVGFMGALRRAARSGGAICDHTFSTCDHISANCGVKTHPFGEKRLRKQTVPRDSRGKSAIPLTQETTAKHNLKGSAMADVNRGNRPLSPHLQVYRPQLNSITSILARITGNALLVTAFLIVWWLIAASGRGLLRPGRRPA
jgi:hypothetical protein